MERRLAGRERALCGDFRCDPVLSLLLEHAGMRLGVVGVENGEREVRMSFMALWNGIGM